MRPFSFSTTKDTKIVSQNWSLCSDIPSSHLFIAYMLTPCLLPPSTTGMKLRYVHSQGGDWHCLNHVTLLIRAVKNERARAEAVYTTTRTEFPPGENTKTDELLDKARQTLDDLAADMLADRPDDWQERKADLLEEQDLEEVDDSTVPESAEHVEHLDGVAAVDDSQEK